MTTRKLLSKSPKAKNPARAPGCPRFGDFNRSGSFRFGVSGLGDPSFGACALRVLRFGNQGIGIESSRPLNPEP